MSDNENQSKLEDKEIPEEQNINNEDNVTREINLDDLYDGAVNNTVVIDPVTNSEVLLPNRRSNHTIIGVILAVLVLLILYYITTKTDFGKTTKDLEPSVTTTTTTMIINETESVTCSYWSKSNSETVDISFNAKGINDKVLTSEFNYSVILNSDSPSAIETDLATQYENLYISNVAIQGVTTTFEKTDKGFTFNSSADYKMADFSSFIMNEGQTVSFVKPSDTDTISSLKELYTNKGFTCSVITDTE